MLRQRKHREKIKQNAEKHEEKKKKHREYMKAVRRPIAELTEKEKEKKRREWRLAKKKQKEGGVTKPKNNKCCALKINKNMYPIFCFNVKATYYSCE